MKFSCLSLKKLIYDSVIVEPVCMLEVDSEKEEFLFRIIAPKDTYQKKDLIGIGYIELAAHIDHVKSPHLFIDLFYNHTKTALLSARSEEKPFLLPWVNTKGIGRLILLMFLRYLLACHFITHITVVRLHAVDEPGLIAYYKTLGFHIESSSETNQYEKPRLTGLPTLPSMRTTVAELIENIERKPAPIMAASLCLRCNKSIQSPHDWI
jgi:hypothetical protein